MQKVKMLAIKSNRDHAIFFDVAGKKYHLRSEPGPLGWDDLTGGTTIESVDLNGYGSDVGYGHGNVPANKSATTPPDAFPADDVSYTNNVLTLNPRGTSTGGYVYLQNKDNTAYAIGTNSSGGMVLKKWMGGNWK